MELSMRVIVRKAARFAVYDEMTIKAKSHQAPIIIRVARVVYGTSPPVERSQDEKNINKCLLNAYL
jgi:hypothetical protein